MADLGLSNVHILKSNLINANITKPVTVVHFSGVGVEIVIGTIVLIRWYDILRFVGICVIGKSLVLQV